MAQILFVDDDAITLKMLCRIAELAGHDPQTASSGTEALQKAAELIPDLIVLDMMMPDMDGLAVITHLRAHPSTADIPVAVLSAGFELDAEEQAKLAGAQAYLTKPINLEVLQEVISRYVEG